MTIEQFQLKLLRASRMRLLHLIKTNTDDLLFRIPNGFNNNIIWQIGHCITSQQRQMYMRSNLPMYISNEFMNSFKIGTSPELWKVYPDIHEIKCLLVETVDRLEIDIRSNLFIDYRPVDLPIGIRLENHVQALQYTNFHEAEHTGRILMYIQLLSF